MFYKHCGCWFRRIAGILGSHLKSVILDVCAFCLHFMPCLVIALIKGHESDCTSAQTFRLVEVCAGIDTEIWLLMMTC